MAARALTSRYAAAIFSPLVRDNHYRIELPHTELSDTTTTTDNSTVF
jgi:hypothetical protein